MTKPAGLNRTQIVETLLERDGDTCRYPGKEHPLDLTAPETSNEAVTIDHWIPQSWGLSHGWTPIEIWALENLKLMCKHHNALKGDRMPLEDGTLPPHPKDNRNIWEIRADKSKRVDVCQTCESGRLLLLGEICDVCGSGPQPVSFPKHAQRSPKECDHHFNHCWMCIVHDPSLRTPAYEDVFGVK